MNKFLTSENQTLRQDVSRLTTELDNQAAAKREEIANEERQASIANGCDYLLPLCPASMTEKGHEAIKRGYSGASDYRFWLAFFGKLFAWGLMFGGCVCALLYGHIWFVSPAREDLARAIAVIEDAKHCMAQAKQRERHADAEVEAAREELRALELDCSDAQSTLDSLEQRLDELSETYDKELAALQAIRTARDALSL